jgi:superfamily II DNA or RNA helicase
MTDTKALITPVERVDAELKEGLTDVLSDLAQATVLSEEEWAELNGNLVKVVEAAQAVIIARLKTRAYAVSESYRNSGADDTPDQDAWEDAVQVADPAAYDPMWVRGWGR